MGCFSRRSILTTGHWVVINSYEFGRGLRDRIQHLRHLPSIQEHRYDAETDVVWINLSAHSKPGCLPSGTRFSMLYPRSSAPRILLFSSARRTIVIEGGTFGPLGRGPSTPRRSRNERPVLEAAVSGPISYLGGRHCVLSTCLLRCPDRGTCPGIGPDTPPRV